MRRKVIMLAGAAALTIGALSFGREHPDRARPCGAFRAGAKLHAGRESCLWSASGQVLRTVASPGLRPLSLLVRALLSA